MATKFTLKQLVGFCMILGILIAVISKVYTSRDAELIKYFYKEQDNFEKASMIFFDNTKNKFIIEDGVRWKKFSLLQKKTPLRGEVAEIKNGLLFIINATYENPGFCYRGFACLQKPPNKNRIVSKLSYYAVSHEIKEPTPPFYRYWLYTPENIVYRPLEGNWYLFLGMEVDLGP